ncbi:FmdB family zinc ribbon protein [Skermanella pratensis]|uniref:FmdB family zinc ribbon protein n=1 Tax=Skermanella pratensis TaxID=2233999 RepID=UPI0013010D8D|nr:zinc ribbon domain-containing protein [Skermanella pratensis]
MPVYDYMCESCGAFTALRPMARSAEPCGCPDCGAPASRAYLSFPSIGGMDPARRAAFETNERSAHAPKLSKKSDRQAAGHSGAHGPGCSCCSGGKSSAVYTRDGAKTFPSKRPWMISH